MSFNEPEGNARLRESSHGREVDVGGIDEEWLAHQHTLQITYHLTTHVAQADDTESTGAGGSSGDLEVDTNEDSSGETTQEAFNDEEQQVAQDNMSDVRNAPDPGWSTHTQDPGLPDGLCEGGGTIVNQLFLGKSYLCLMKTTEHVPGHSRRTTYPPVAAPSGATTISSSALVPCRPSEALVCRTVLRPPAAWACRQSFTPCPVGCAHSLRKLCVLGCACSAWMRQRSLRYCTSIIN